MEIMDSNKKPEIQNEMLKSTLLEIFDEFASFCEENELNYFLIGGTLLGALRHKGFIPWDDDLDVAMPREDYKKFIELYNNEETDYFMHCMEVDPEYWMPFAKFRKKHTLYDSGSTRGAKSNRGIFIDIFPLDNANEPDDFFQGIRAKAVKFMRKIVKSKISIEHSKDNEDRKKYLAKSIVELISRPISINKLVKAQQYLMMWLSKKETKYFINLGSQYNYKKQTIPKDVYFPTKKLEFEGKLYQVPGEYEYILERIYGDFMKLPPVGERISHNPDKIIFDTRQ